MLKFENRVSVKKVSIKGLASKASDLLQETADWNLIAECIRSAFKSQSIKLLLHHSKVLEALVRQNFAVMHRFEEMIRESMNDVEKNIDLLLSQGRSTAAVFDETWSKLQVTATQISILAVSLYEADLIKAGGIRSLIYEAFALIVLTQKDSILSELCSLLNKHRSNPNEVRFALVKRLCDMFERIEFAKELLLPSLCQCTRIFFCNFEPCSVDHVKDIVQNEELMAKELLSSNYRNALISVIDEVILLPRLGFLRGCLVEALEHDKNIQLVCSLLLRVSSQGDFDQTLLKAITDLSSSFLSKNNYIPLLNSLHARVQSLLSSSLLSTAFSSVLSVNEVDSAEELAKYFDSCIKAGTIPDLCLFKCLKDREHFEHSYRKYLAHRLLLLDCNLSLEQQMLETLKQMCGHAFTNRMEIMLKDIQDQHKSGEGPFSAILISSGIWPEARPTDLFTFTIPEHITAKQKRFEQDYKRRERRRQVQWNSQLSMVRLLVRFENGPKELHVSSLQASILLKVTEHNDLSVGRLAQELKTDPKNVAENVLYLSSRKILLKSGNPRSVHLSDVLDLNLSFTSPAYRLRLHDIQFSTHTKQADEEVSRETTLVKDADYWARLDAAVVRILRRDQRVNFEQLQRSLDSEAAHLQATLTDIKKSLVSLEEKHFCRRCTESDDVHVYLP